ncbi:reverse transcriptase domain-containing protein [Algoriphagus persicinus]|uniref:reverse transcriptase domain-containing protein n=1 Tax=Algoriphagus persicinus TaxID=3108754 RepID=UPI002B4112F3|nr:reverse transcriptase domain-containing protein [Algoriphagus sp. E1-3-M2]
MQLMIDHSLWLKKRGYYHLTPKLDVIGKQKEYLSKVTNPKFVCKHGFFPLLHASIKERRYKKCSPDGKRSHVDPVKGPTAKDRPLHFATHIDSLIFGYYAQKLQVQYENVLQDDPHLSEAITAYRKIYNAEDPERGKSTIHFAHEVFSEIKKQALLKGSCAVLKFDLEKFFSSIDHQYLKISWAKIIGKESLPLDHYKVFRAATSFSYILKDDLRKSKKRFGSRSGFDERKLSQIRKHGIESYFGSHEEFRKAVKDGEVKIFKNPFRSKDKKKKIGIPQGLPISSVLANLYLLEFDQNVIHEVVKELGGFYRRYSDDIIIVTDCQHESKIVELVMSLISKYFIAISNDKTEVFHFAMKENGSVRGALKSKEGNFSDNYPLNYLGFDFYGDRTLIAAKNLSKFYRRMKASIKRKTKVAAKLKPGQIEKKPGVFFRQLYRIYSNSDLDRYQVRTRRISLTKNRFGEYVYKSKVIPKPMKGNYFSYVKRASRIMGEPAIANQLRNHRKIFNSTLKRRMES